MRKLVRGRLKQRRPLFLREWRKHRALTQEQLAERTGLTQGLISQLENNTSDYSGQTITALAEGLNCEPADLMMRNPMDPEAPWSIWETLKPVEKRQAVEIIKGSKG